MASKKGATHAIDRGNDRTGFSMSSSPILSNIPDEVENDLSSTGTKNTTNDSNSNVSNIEEIYENEREQSKIRNWKESPYAVGLVEATWADELNRVRSRSRDGNSNGGPCGAYCNDEADPTCGCLSISAIVCTKLGAKRVGNMAILKESVETAVEDDRDDEAVDCDLMDEENQEQGLVGSKRKRVVFRRKMDIVVGPFWPMLVCVTYPLIISISMWTAVVALPGKHPLFIFFWLCCTVGLCLALFSTGCRDPGIMLRRRDSPQSVDVPWRWNDQALTWRPLGSFYDGDCACVVEEFDHT